MSHIMIDIETLGKAPNGCLVQIGWAEFDEEKVLRSGQFSIDPASAQREGMVIDASTVEFWMQQDKKVVESVFTKEYSLADALCSLAFIIPNWSKIEGVWTNAPLFDFAILRHAYNLIDGLKTPWNYRQERDSRTLFWAGKQAAYAKNIEFNIPIHDNEDMKHDAEVDAVYQAKVVIYLLKLIKQGKLPFF